MATIQAIDPKQQAIATHSTPSLETGKQLIQLLTMLAEARQAAINPDTLKLYSGYLRAYDLNDVQDGVESLMLRTREPGETAFPDLGTVISEVDRAVYKRERRAQELERKMQIEEETERRYQRVLAQRPELKGFGSREQTLNEAWRLQRAEHKAKMDAEVQAAAEAARARLKEANGAKAAEAAAAKAKLKENADCPHCGGALFLKGMSLEDISPADLRILADASERRQQLLKAEDGVQEDELWL